MERECCLSFLIALIGGIALLGCGWWPVTHFHIQSALALEKIKWRRIWLPLTPALAVASALCGWAVVEPDPIPEGMPVWLILMSAPFLGLLARAAVRSAWALITDPGEPGTATVGLLRPWIVFSPRLAKKLDERQIEAALEHERAHTRHRDPLRIWLAQIATDLQWPWPQARERMQQWLVALEFARDEEARGAGIEGADLADAIIASARFSQSNHLLT
jgi:Zn-dependent protease with chaperone function